MKHSSLIRRIAVSLGACLAFVSVASKAADLVPVRVGLANASSDVGFFIADKKGYFKQEGLSVSFTPFDSAAKMVAPLGAGQIEVGAGSPSVGLYNAIARGIEIKIVAD
ncbi:MAG TPA: ABC transporter substrate-binding protein, partial [Herbaspirillum sp.]